MIDGALGGGEDWREGPSEPGAEMASAKPTPTLGILKRLKNTHLGYPDIMRQV